MDQLPRLIYLAEEHRPPFPKSLSRIVPQGDLILAVATKGLTKATLDSSLPKEQLAQLYEKGKKGAYKKNDVGSIEEFQMLVGQLASTELELRKEEMDFTEYLGQFQLVSQYVTSIADELVDTQEVDLGSEFDEPVLPKFPSGYGPLDAVTDGLYQGILTVVGKTGHGKTRNMLTLMGALKQTRAASSVWFYEVEIPLSLMLYMTKDMRDRVKFEKGDKIRTGMFTTKEILDAIEEDPDPNRVIFIDGPDAMAVASGEGKRFALEYIYRDIMRIKQRSKLVVVSSQSRRKDSTITLESVAEAWAKTWYSDVVIGVQKVGRAPGGLSRIRMNIVKNRFGVEGREIMFPYNFETLGWELDQFDIEAMEAEEDW